MTGDWIAEARADYEARPWVCWALRCGVPVYEPMIGIGDTAEAIAEHVGLAGIDTIAGAEMGTENAEHKRRALTLLRAVSHELQDIGVTHSRVTAAINAAYAARGIELLKASNAPG